MSRARCGVSRRVPGLKYAHIVRDAWTRLNVWPAKIMQVHVYIYMYTYIDFNLYYTIYIMVIARAYVISDKRDSRE